MVSLFYLLVFVCTNSLLMAISFYFFLKPQNWKFWIVLNGVVWSSVKQLTASKLSLNVCFIIFSEYSINESQFYKWNKEFLEAGKKRLAGDVTREATSDEVAELKKENQRLKVMIADLVLRYDIVKKSLDMLD